MKKLSIDKLSEGLTFYNGSTAEVYIEFTHDDHITLSNFIAKYEEHISIMIQSHFADGFMFNLNASSPKDIYRICDIMSEDIDVVNLEIFSITDGWITWKKSI